MIRESPGNVIIRKIPCPRPLSDACLKLQAAWRQTYLRRLQLVERELLKPTLKTILGVAFSHEFRSASVIKAVRGDGPAAGVLAEGDRLLAINGQPCDNPASAAKILREAVGTLKLVVQPRASVDTHELLAREMVEEEQEEATEGRSTAGILRPTPVVLPRAAAELLPSNNSPSPPPYIRTSSFQDGEEARDAQMQNEAGAGMQAPVSPADSPSSDAIRSPPKRPSQSGRLYEAGGWKDWMSKRRTMNKTVVRPALTRPALTPIGIAPEARV